MVQPVFFPGLALLLRHDRPRRRKALHNVHHAFRRRLQEHLLFARLQVHRHKIPGGDHAAGDIRVGVIHAHDVAAPGTVGMARPNRAEILDHLAEFRVVDVEADPIAPGPRAVDPSVRPDRQRADLAAEARDDFAPLLQRVRRRVVDEHVHVPSLPERGGNVVLPVEAQRTAREVELMTVRQTLLLHQACAQIDGEEPGGSVILLEVHLQHVPALAVVVGHHPAFPDVHPARRLAQRLRLQQRRMLQSLLEVRLFDGAPRLGGGDPRTRQQRDRCAPNHPPNAACVHVRIPFGL